jgi:hypothetical protein
MAATPPSCRLGTPADIRIFTYDAFFLAITN